ncbi:MAG: GNAT family N-acetyltransferase, partial [Magnetococcales bacterium]|nr:GNAT family N-acetyltransferase [Magnetococcales bacterium]
DLAAHQVKLLILAQQTGEVTAFLDRLVSAFLTGEIVRLQLVRETIPVALWRLPAVFMICEMAAQSADHFLEQVSMLGVTLRLPRVLVMHRMGGADWLDRHGKSLSFVNPTRLKHLLQHKGAQDGHTGMHWRLQETILTWLLGGVGAVSVCRLQDLARELFSYEGDGVFCARRHYCQVRRLQLDDYARAAAVIRRGEQEGFLLPRTDTELTDVLVQGYGAFIAEHHLSGVCALVTAPYQSRNAGEITALYALTRFQGEGVGGRLVTRLIQEARLRHLELLFACVRDPRAVAFFEHHGFRRVAHESLPEEKWRHYDPERKARITCLARSPGGA